jgi:YHS domain-containing protein/thiol-disulfide isomerase/thioredoxin
VANRNLLPCRAIGEEGQSMRCAAKVRRAGLLVIVLAWPLAAGAQERQTETWRRDFDGAEAEAKQNSLPMLVHFHASWCGPCQEMEHTVLRDPVLLRKLRTGFVAVKVDSDQRPDLVKRFHVEKLPTDLFLDPRGFVLSRSSGIHDRESYLAQVARIDAMFAQSRAIRIASQTKPLLRDPLTNESPMPLGSTPPPIAPDPTGTRAVEPVPIAVAIGAQPTWASGPRGSNRRWMSLGLRGFSPVALVTRREWSRGEQQYAAEYKGIVYFLASAQELRRFKESPDHYAPQILGCDPVILDIADRAVPGDIRYAAFFEGDLYLFVSDKSRQLFRQDPRRFVRSKHVLKVDDLDEKRLE